MSSLTVEQAAGQLDALVDAALAGDDIILAKNGREVRLVPLAPVEPSQSDQKPWAQLLQNFAGKAEGLPSDMAKNHDHYLHGAAKK